MIAKENSGNTVRADGTQARLNREKTEIRSDGPDRRRRDRRWSALILLRREERTFGREVPSKTKQPPQGEAVSVSPMERLT